MSSKTSCCNFEYIGENHNPIEDLKVCRHCGHIHEFLDDKIDMLEQRLKEIEKIAELVNASDDFFENHLECIRLSEKYQGKWE